MICKDDSLNYLNHIGYNVIKLPLENIKPLLVIGGKKTGLKVLGPLSDFVLDAQYSPEVIYGGEAPKITGKKSNKLDLGLGLDLMNRLLSAMGAVSGGIDVKYEKASQIQIVFENVLSDYVYPTEIDKYLLSGKPKTESLLTEWIDEDGEAYIITETIKSNSFGVIAYDKSGHSMEIEVSGIQDLLGGSAKINPSKEGSNEILYKGEKLLAFGFRAISFSIHKDDGVPKFKLTPAKKPLVMRGMRGGATDQQGNVVFAREELLEIDF
jgi:hypothetical protein